MEGNLLACYWEDFFPDGKLESRTPSSHALDLVFLSSVIPGMAAPPPPPPGNNEATRGQGIMLATAETERTGALVTSPSHE